MMGEHCFSGLYKLYRERHPRYPYILDLSEEKLAILRKQKMEEPSGRATEEGSNIHAIDVACTEQNTTKSQFSNCIDRTSDTNCNICKECGPRRRVIRPRHVIRQACF